MPASHETVDQHLHFIKMGGPKTFQLAVIAMSKACQAVLDKSGYTPEQIRWAIPHQANERIISAVAERLHMENKVYRNVSRYGNTSSASIGICLDELNRSGQLKKDDLLLTAAFGAGLTWAAEMISW